VSVTIELRLEKTLPVLSHAEVWWEEALSTAGTEGKVLGHFWKAEMPLTLTFIFHGSFLPPLLRLHHFHGRLQATARCWRHAVSKERGSAEKEEAAPIFRSCQLWCL